MNENFQPIYLWAQALDNESEDDFYEISPKHVHKMQDLPQIQAIVSEMGDINEHDNRTLTAILQRFNHDLKKAAQHNNKILLTFSSPDQDRANRQSNIDVLLDIERVNESNFVDYLRYFYDGFTQFCDKTQRKAHVLNAENHFNEVVADILGFRLPEKVNATVLPDVSKSIHTETPPKKRGWFISMIVTACAALFIYLLFKK